jgi:hypothetical protein
VLGILGSRRFADLLLLSMAGWYALLLAWSQTSPLAIVQRIGTMWAFRGLYAALAVNLFACFLIELPRALRRSAPRTVPPGEFPPPGHEEVATPDWDGLDTAEVSLRRRAYRTRREGVRLVAERGRFAPVLGMLFHLILPLLLPAAVLSLANRQTFSMDVGEGEVVEPLPGGPRARIGVERIDPRYLGGEIYFTQLTAAVSVDGAPAREIRINDPVTVDGGDLRIVSMGFMPGLAISDPDGALLDRAFVKAGLFPPGTEAELTFAGSPHRLLTSFYPDAERGPDGEPRNATLNLRRPLLKVRAVRGKLPISTAVLSPGESMELEGFHLGLEEARLWVKLEWVRDPSAHLALWLCAAALMLLGAKVFWPRTTWIVEESDGGVRAARRVEAPAALSDEGGADVP